MAAISRAAADKLRAEKAEAQLLNLQEEYRAVQQLYERTLDAEEEKQKEETKLRARIGATVIGEEVKQRRDFASRPKTSKYSH